MKNKFENLELPEGYFLFPWSVAHVAFKDSSYIILYDIKEKVFLSHDWHITFADSNTGIYIYRNHHEARFDFVHNENIVILTKFPEKFKQISINWRQG